MMRAVHHLGSGTDWVIPKQLATPAIALRGGYLFCSGPKKLDVHGQYQVAGPCQWGFELAVAHERALSRSGLPQKLNGLSVSPGTFWHLDLVGHYGIRPDGPLWLQLGMSLGDYSSAGFVGFVAAARYYLEKHFALQLRTNTFFGYHPGSSGDNRKVTWTNERGEVVEVQGAARSSSGAGAAGAVISLEVVGRL